MATAQPTTPLLHRFLGIGLVVLLFKPRVPRRRPGQSVEQYWTTPDTTEKVLPVWFLLEGAGMIANVGYLLTGESVSVIAMGVAIVAFWWCGPNAFAKT